jgi:pyruvate/2-oxoglutarate dehydrogenase complex dihydrolipoamide acyltransferase (E2) component
MSVEIRLPRLGQTSDEMTIVEWLKAEGEPVLLGEALLIVETDKAIVEVPAAVAGTLTKIIARPGEEVESGALIACIAEPNATPPRV